MTLSCQRDRFLIPPDLAYLNSAYMGPISRATLEAGKSGVGRKASPWRITPPDFFTEVNQLRGLVAKLLMTRAEHIALIPSVSYGIAVAARNLPLERGKTVITLDESFPSMVYAWRQSARDSGAEHLTVPRPADDDWTAAVLERIDSRTAVVSVPQIHWTDGGLLNLEAIGARLREVGAALVVDATQSLGVLPLDVNRIRPDFLMAAGYKWLLGPYGLGYLYAAPERQQGRPLEENWISRPDSEDFAGLTRYRDGYQPGARRYDVGETSNFALVPMAIAALEEVLDWNPARILEYTAAINDRIIAGLEGSGLAPVPNERRGRHYLGLRSRTPFPPELLYRLSQEQVHLSIRGQSLRISPHVFNNLSDADRLVRVVGDVLAEAG